MVNKNCLKGLRCPECGYADRFQIVGSANFDVTDDGSDTFKDLGWSDNSGCVCAECNHFGMVSDFTEERKPLRSFRVTWTIDIDAETPREAARGALDIQRDSDSTATVFEVVNSSTEMRTEVDLGEKVEGDEDA